MQQNYSKKIEPIQKTSKNTASSVLDTSSQNESLQRKADMANNAAQREEAPRPNNTGMPDNLKSGIESLSGFSMDDVRVHYNSSKPATVQALAYTQGTDIHVAPGQEKHLPHEAWHVAQQMAGRVSPTTNINGMPVNDNAGLEHEADVMGEKAYQYKKCTRENIPQQTIKNQKTAIQKMMTAALDFEKKYVIDEKQKQKSAFFKITKTIYDNLKLSTPPISTEENIAISNVPCQIPSFPPPVTTDALCTILASKEKGQDTYKMENIREPSKKDTHDYNNGNIVKRIQEQNTYHIFYQENGGFGKKHIRHDANVEGYRWNKSSKRPDMFYEVNEMDSLKTKPEIVLDKIKDNEDICIVSHGCKPTFFSESQFTDDSPKQLANKIFKILPNNYKGEIYLNGCETALPRNRFQDGTSYAERFGTELEKLAMDKQIEIHVKVKGNIGCASTSKTGKRNQVELNATNKSFYEQNFKDRWENEKESYINKHLDQIWPELKNYIPRPPEPLPMQCPQSLKPLQEALYIVNPSKKWWLSTFSEFVDIPLLLQNLNDEEANDIWDAIKTYWLPRIKSKTLQNALVQNDTTIDKKCWIQTYEKELGTQFFSIIPKIDPFIDRKTGKKTEYIAGRFAKRIYEFNFTPQQSHISASNKDDKNQMP